MGLLTVTGLTLSGALDARTISLKYLMFIMTGIADSHMAMLFGTFFKNANLAADLGATLSALTGLCYLLVIQSNQIGLYYIASLFPHTANLLAAFALDKKGQSESLPVPFSYSDAMTMQIVNIVINFAIYYYLDNVLPTEYGESKHPLFCLLRKKIPLRPPESTDVDENSLQIPLLQAAETEVESSSQTEPRDRRITFFPRASQPPPELYDSKHYESIVGPENTPALTVQRLHKYYGDHPALKEINITLYEGEIVCLLGKNGAGKSTMIGILSGMMPRSFGTIYYGTTEFDGKYSVIKRKIGVCPQHDILYPFMSPLQHLRFLAKLKDIPKQERESHIQELLVECGLANVQHKPVRALKISNKRLLSLAEAVLGYPKVIFLDEPFSEADQETRERVWKLLKRLRNEGTTILLATQDMIEAQNPADRIAILVKGKIYALGSLDYIKETFGVGYRIKVVPKSGVAVSSNLWKETAVKIDQIISIEHSGPTRDGNIVERVLEYTVPNDPRLMAEILKELENMSHINVSIRFTALEDIFLKMSEKAEKIKKLPSKFKQLNAECTSIRKPAIPQYRVRSQIIAMFRRKYLNYRRSKYALLSSVLPIVFMVVGNILIKEAFPDGKQSAEHRKKANAITFVFNIIFGICINLSPFCGFIVSERETNMKFMAAKMGCRRLPYWLGTFLFDFSVCSAIVVVLVIYVYLGGIELMAEHIIWFFFLSLAFVAALLTMSYLWSFVYRRTESAFKSFGIICLFALYTIPLVLMDVAVYEDITWLVWIFQPIGFVVGPMIPYQASFFLIAAPDRGSPFEHLVYEKELFYFLHLLGLAALYMSLAGYLENRKQLRPKFRNVVGTVALPVIEPNNLAFSRTDTPDLDFSVVRFNAPSLDPVRFENVELIASNGSKVIQDLNFSVRIGETFGLLGPSGSGKSTIVNMMIGQTFHSEGSLNIFNQPTSGNIKNVYPEIGLCPQTSALWSFATVREHLEIFARIKGLSGTELNEEVQYIIESLEMAEIADKYASELSLGDKRILSVGIASIACPAIQIYDEPSIGMDPMSKRKFWKYLLIVKRRRPCSIIITTQLIKEAENICNRIGILINGTLTAKGSVNYFREKYNKGHVLSVVRSADYSKNEFKNKLIKRFTIERLEETTLHHHQERYRLVGSEFKVSELFSMLSKLKEKGKLENFAIYKSSFNYAFNEICQAQLKAKQEANDEKQI